MFTVVDKQKKKYETAQMSVDAYAVLDGIAEDTGLPKTVILERIMAFLKAESDVVVGVILGTMPKSVAPDLAKLLLQKLAGEQGVSPTEADQLRAALDLLRAETKETVQQTIREELAKAAKRKGA